MQYSLSVSYLIAGAGDLDTMLQGRTSVESMLYLGISILKLSPRLQSV